MASNDPRVLVGMPASHVDSADVHKFLGLLWNSKNDTLEINKFELEGVRTTKMTHKSMCAEVGKLFDPIGQIQPLIVPAKILLQDLWRAKVTWDEVVPEPLQRRWEVIAQSFEDLAPFKLSRWINPGGYAQVELHGFSDASQVAYGAVIYAKFGLSSPTVSFIMAKSRVAPCKPVSIPRLELKAALLLSDLMKKANEFFVNENFSPRIYGWSDAKVALAWIRASPEKWKQFVRNRVATIQESIPPSNWNYVSTADNPADIISRGCDSVTLKKSSFWLNGPAWLKQTDMMDVGPHSESLEEEDWTCISKEEKTKNIVAAVVTTGDQDFISRMSTKYSNFSKSCRILAWVLRFASNCRGARVLRNEVTIEEIRKAEIHFIINLQGHHFGRELAALIQGKPVGNQSPLRQLNPFVDTCGALRVGVEFNDLPYRTTTATLLFYRHLEIWSISL